MRPSLLLALLFGCSPTVTHDSSAVADDVQAVRVEVGAGHISVVGGDRLAVERTLSGVAVEGATQAIEDGVLRVAVACDTVLPCSADITLTVPAGVPVDVQVRDGGVYLADLDQDVRVEVGDGEVRGEGLAGATRVRSGWGGAWLAFRSPPREVQVGVGVGDVFLSVPDAGYDLDVRGLAGQDVAVRADAAGPRVQVQTSGRVSVQPARGDLAAR